MFILTARWKEPAPGIEAWNCEITDAEAHTVESILNWLEEHAKNNWGDTLAEWTLQASTGTGGDLIGLGAVLDNIALNSRYNEIPGAPGDYYGATNPLLDGR